MCLKLEKKIKFNGVFFITSISLPRGDQTIYKNLKFVKLYKFTIYFKSYKNWKNKFLYGPPYMHIFEK